jgi:hypothetical protein
MHVTCPRDDLIGALGSGFDTNPRRVSVTRASEARRPNDMVKGKQCCHCTSSNTKLGFLWLSAGTAWAEGARYNIQLRRLRRLAICCYRNNAFAYIYQSYSSFFVAGADIDAFTPFFFSSSPFPPLFLPFFLSL